MADDPIERFPLTLLTPQSAALRKVAAIFSGPPGLASPPQTIQNGAGRWGLTYRNIRIAKASERLVARAFLSRLTSPLQPVLVSPMEWLTSPRRLAGMPQFVTTSPFSDGATFLDGSEFAADPLDFVMAADAPAGSREISVAGNFVGLAVQGGQFVEIGDRLYLVEKSFGETATQTLQIWPALRADASSGDAVETENPHARMRLDQQSAEIAVEMMFGRYGYFDLAFVEDDWTL